MYHRSSLDVCSGSNITSPLGWTFWSTTVATARVWAVQGKVSAQEVPLDVQVALEVGKAFMEAICLHAVFDA